MTLTAPTLPLSPPPFNGPSSGAGPLAPDPAQASRWEAFAQKVADLALATPPAAVAAILSALASRLRADTAWAYGVAARVVGRPSLIDSNLMPAAVAHRVALWAFARGVFLENASPHTAGFAPVVHLAQISAEPGADALAWWTVHRAPVVPLGLLDTVIAASLFGRRARRFERLAKARQARPDRAQPFAGVPALGVAPPAAEMMRTVIQTATPEARTLLRAWLRQPLGLRSIDASSGSALWAAIFAPIAEHEPVARAFWDEPFVREAADAVAEFLLDVGHTPDPLADPATAALAQRWAPGAWSRWQRRSLDAGLPEGSAAPVGRGRL